MGYPLIGRKASNNPVHVVWIADSSSTTGAGLTGVLNSSTGLVVEERRELEAAFTSYTSAGSTVDTITTLGTYAAPTATHIRFKEIGDGWYELQFSQARFGTGDASRFIFGLIKGVTNMAPCPFVIPLTAIDMEDAVRLALSALPNAAAGANTGLPVVGTQVPNATAAANGGLPTVDANNAVKVQAGTGTGQLDFTSGVLKSNLVQILGTVLTEGGAGRLATSFKTFLDIASPVFTAASVNQTGDAFARLGAPSGASVSADILSLLNRLTAARAGVLDALSLRTNTAQAGAAGSITFDAGASATDDLYKGQWVAIVSGTGAGQARLITGYVGATKVASVHRNWATAPDATSVFYLLSAADVYGVVLLDTLTTYTGNAPQTGDAYARLGAPVGASTSADIASVLAKTPDAAHFTNARGDKLDNLDAAVSTRSTLGGTAQTGDVYATLTSAQAEPVSVPAANASPLMKLAYVFAKLRNKRTTTATTDTLRNAGDTATISSAALADDGTTFSKGEDA